MIPILFSIATVLFAGDEPKPRIVLAPEVQSAVDLARSAAPEVFADAMVRLVQAGRIPQREAQIELLNQAYAAAGDAVEPVRLIAMPTTPPDTRELYRARAGDLGLDVLSLQSRILKELLTVDPARARERFAAIHRPTLEARPCIDPLVADASAYYEIAAAIAQSAFSPEEKRQEAHVQFLTAVLSGVTSPGELVPFARSLHTVALNPPEWTLLAAAFAAKLESIAPDYRPFALSFDALQAEIDALQEITRSEQLPQAFRKYTASQLTAPRCSPDIAIAFDPKDLKPAKHDEAFQASDPYFSTGDAKGIGEELRSVQPGARFENFLRDFLAWAPAGSDADILHQRATVFGALIQLLPPGVDRDRVLDLAAAMLASSEAQRKAPGEWMWQARHLTDLARADASKLFAAFRESGSAALAVYGRLP
jgi:hypothetical protein